MTWCSTTQDCDTVIYAIIYCICGYLCFIAFESTAAHKYMYDNTDNIKRIIFIVKMSLCYINITLYKIKLIFKIQCNYVSAIYITTINKGQG